MKMCHIYVAKTNWNSYVRYAFVCTSRCNTRTRVSRKTEELRVLYIYPQNGAQNPQLFECLFTAIHFLYVY